MLALLATAVLATAAVPADADHLADVEFALAELEKQCSTLIRSKDLPWKQIEKRFLKEAKAIETDTDELVLLQHLIAAMQDGHARVVNHREVPWPEMPEHTVPGMGLCRIGKKFYVKNSRAAALELGVVPGMEVVKIDGQKPEKWLAEHVAKLRELESFSTDHHAWFNVMTYGPALPIDTRLDLELKFEGKKKKRTLTYPRTKYFLLHPGQLPEGLTRTESDHSYGVLPSGHGYVHLRRVPQELPAELEPILAALGDVPGLVLDCRGNTGGGTDHDAVFGRFVPKGETFQGKLGKSFPSSGANPYGGPIVVIVDGTVVSSGETISGQLSEEGRAYMIGESPTAGMSSQKTTIDLPSGKFSLYVSTHSNKSQFNQGNGIEGIGVQPHELVEYDPEDLAAKRDTLILRAIALLEDFPADAVTYDPAKFGWTPPSKTD